MADAVKPSTSIIYFEGPRHYRRAPLPVPSCWQAGTASLSQQTKSAQRKTFTRSIDYNFADWIMMVNTVVHKISPLTRLRSNTQRATLQIAGNLQAIAPTAFQRCGSEGVAQELEPPFTTFGNEILFKPTGIAGIPYYCTTPLTFMHQCGLNILAACQCGYSCFDRKSRRNLDALLSTNEMGG